MTVLQARAQSGQVIVALRGQLDTTAAAGAAAMVAAAGSPGQPVIVDLAELDYLDCSVLAALIAAQRRARRDGGDVLLAAPHGLVRRLLILTGLDSVFGVYPSVAAACAAVPLAATMTGQRPAGTEVCHDARA